MRAFWKRRDKSKPESTTYAELRLDAEAYLSQMTSEASAATGLGDEDRWEFSQDTGELSLIFQDRVLVADAQMIGSFMPHAREWRWAWANRTIDEKLKESAYQVLQFAIDNGIEELQLPTLECEEMGAWSMAAIAAFLTNAECGYRGEDDDVQVFLAIHNLRVRSADG